MEIAHASERLIGIALGAEDYVRNLRTERSPEGIELLFARCSILQAARSAGIQAFDTVYSDANNEAGFLQEAAHIKQLGFDGKSLINPRQIDLLHNLYAPTQKEVDHARRSRRPRRGFPERQDGGRSGYRSRPSGALPCRTFRHPRRIRQSK